MQWFKWNWHKEKNMSISSVITYNNTACIFQTTALYATFICVIVAITRLVKTYKLQAVGIGLVAPLNTGKHDMILNVVWIISISLAFVFAKWLVCVCKKFPDLYNDKGQALQPSHANDDISLVEDFFLLSCLFCSVSALTHYVYFIWLLNADARLAGAKRKFECCCGFV